MSIVDKLAFRSSLVESGCVEMITKTRCKHHQLHVGGRLQMSHRLAYEELVGPIPEGKSILHKCDNPICINPDHLEVGDLELNNRQRSWRKRSDVRFSKAQIEGVIAFQGSHTAAAKKFGMSVVYAWQLRTENYKRIQDFVVE